MSSIIRRRRPWRFVVAFIVILMVVFAVVPAASADARHGHRRHVIHFVVLSTDASPSAKQIVIARGAIHARGSGTQVSETRDVFTFPDGSLSVRHKMRGHGKDTFDRVTCYFTYREHGTYTVTGGTGAYAHAHGRGHYSLRVAGVGCDPNSPPDLFSLEVRASGPLRF